MDNEFLPIDVENLVNETNNIYEAVIISGKHANRLTSEIKEELGKKLAEFAPAHDTLEEIMENREQIEISKYYEAKPKATQQGLQAFERGELYFRNPNVPGDTNLPEGSY